MASNRYLSSSLILQTLQQLRDVYGDSVDKIIQGNTENIVFLKSTDESMIETLVKMSGTTHESRTDSKTVTRDNERLFNQNEGKISYTMTTKERPVIQFNDFMFIKERNSIIIKAGGSPIWNRNETAYPMSWRLFSNQIKIPGKKFSLQTVPTNSTAIDFDIRKNQPNFFAMLDQRLEQAKEATEMRERYMRGYDIGESEFILRDQNVVSDEIMDAINTVTRGGIAADDEDVEISPAELVATGDDMGGGDDLLAGATENTELVKEQSKIANGKETHELKRYANGLISRNDLVQYGTNQANRQLEKVLAVAYEACQSYFDNDNNYRVIPDTSELISPDGERFVRSTAGADKDDVRALDEAGDTQDTPVYTEDGAIATSFAIEDAFLHHLVTFENWSSIAGGRFDLEVANAYQKWNN